MHGTAAVTTGPDHIIRYANRAYQNVKPHVPISGALFARSGRSS